MRLGSYIKKLPDFTEFVDRQKEILETQIFEECVSTSKFGDDVWALKKGNEKVNFNFEINGERPDKAYVFFWKMLFLVTIYQGNKSFKTAMGFYNSISHQIRFLQELELKSGMKFGFFKPQEYFHWIESKGGASETKLHKWRALLAWREYNSFLWKPLRLENTDIPRVRFMDEPKKKASLEFLGHEPLTFEQYAKAMTLATYAIEKYGNLLLEMYERGAKKDEYLEILSGEEFLRFDFQRFNPETLIQFLQGACTTLVLGLCPMRHKELRDLRVKDFQYAPNSPYSILVANVEKTGQGLYQMPLHNAGAKSVRLLQKMQKHKSNNCLFSFLNEEEQAYDEQISIRRLKTFTQVINLGTQITPHRLRTTVARYFLFSKGMEGVYLFKSLVGHTDIRMTLNHYAKYSLSEECAITSMAYERIKSRSKYAINKAISQSSDCEKINLPFCAVFANKTSPLLNNKELMVLAGAKTTHQKPALAVLRNMLKIGEKNENN